MIILQKTNFPTNLFEKNGKIFENFDYKILNANFVRIIEISKNKTNFQFKDNKIIKSDSKTTNFIQACSFFTGFEPFCEIKFLQNQEISEILNLLPLKISFSNAETLKTRVLSAPTNPAKILR